MWSESFSVTADVPAAAVWSVLSDVEGWSAWNDGVRAIELDGPVAVGTAFRMTMPDGEILASVIDALETGRVLTDLTVFEGVAIRVEHRVETAGDATSITYRIEVSGEVPDEVAADIGQGVSADFPEVLDALVATARARQPA